jgi:hypothetical protein
MPFRYYLSDMIKRLSIEGKKNEAPIDALLARSMLMLRGDTLNGWAIKRGWCGMYAHLAVRGLRRGPKARSIVEALRKELGL